MRWKEAELEETFRQVDKVGVVVEVDIPASFHLLGAQGGNPASRASAPFRIDTAMTDVFAAMAATAACIEVTLHRRLHPCARLQQASSPRRPRQSESRE
jgi:hypothetical protein